MLSRVAQGSVGRIGRVPGAKMIDLSAVDLDELAMALADQDGFEHHWLIDPDSGRILLWTEDDGISDDRAGTGLARAIRGRGAFRRFKDELHEEYPDLLPAWYAFRDARAQRRAVDGPRPPRYDG
jgi:hypothetical protein